MNQQDAILKDFRKHLDDVYKVFHETIDVIKTIHIAKYNQDEFRAIVSQIHHEKIMDHYSKQLQEQKDVNRNN